MKQYFISKESERFQQQIDGFASKLTVRQKYNKWWKSIKMPHWKVGGMYHPLKIKRVIQ